MSDIFISAFIDLTIKIIHTRIFDSFSKRYDSRSKNTVMEMKPTVAIKYPKITHIWGKAAC